MKNLQQIIQQRRSRFPAEYTGGTIEQRDLEEILEAARWAPTHKKTQPWRYKVFQDEGLKKLADFMGSQHDLHSGKSGSMKSRKMKEKITKSAAVILIFMHRDKKERIPEWEEIAAVSMSVQNMWLTIHQLGYGAYWSSPKSYMDMNKFDLINTAPNDQFMGFLYVGTIEPVVEQLPKRMTPAEFVEMIN